MSRVGKKPISVPKDVEIKIEKDEIFVKGPKGELKRKILSEIGIEMKEGKIFILPKIKTKKTKAIWGLMRALIFNMVKGVVEGFEKKLEIEGIGYRAELEGNDLILYLGFSHPIEVKALEGIKFSVQKNIITVSGVDKELVGQIAARIRKSREPDAYKGKGIRYLGEKIKLKPGKKIITTK
ncbi:50S ribosomal protein L6 [Parcubacteria bacterium DG_74_2]|nr:MAG: 50S ribosomal protein L6 [Parcubacteria bacterium DG_74_2]